MWGFFKGKICATGAMKGTFFSTFSEKNIENLKFKEHFFSLHLTKPSSITNSH